MKLNEAKYRSPEWLRNFVDFEVNTGEDIKGEPSKRKAAKLEKEKQAELKRQAEEKVEADRKLKQQQQRAEANKREQQAREDSWKKQADAKEKQDQIEREINTLYRSMISDFSSARYSDKITTPQRNGKTAFYYTFENGKIMRMYKSSNNDLARYQLESETHIYTLGLVWTGKFIDLANEMIKKGGRRPTSGRSSGSSGSSGRSSGSSQRTSSTGHPKGNLYNTLKQTIKQREEQLSKMTKQDPSRAALENELANAKTKVADMKTKYQFENLKSFEDFID